MPRKIRNFVRRAFNRVRPVPKNIKLGGSVPPGPPDPRDYKFEDSGLGGAAPSKYIIPENLLMPVGNQAWQDCGSWALAAATYTATRWDCSQRWHYFKSRQQANPNTPPANLPDGGTYASTNMSVAANKGQASKATWPYEGSINEVPSAAADAEGLTRKITYYAASATQNLFDAISSNHAPFVHFYCTTDFYGPAKCADGTYEVLTPGAVSTKIGGHFTVLDAYDTTRKMLDGTTGGVRVRNSWSTSWGEGGKAWVSIAYWLSATGGHLQSRYAITTQVQQPVFTPVPGVPILHSNPTATQKIYLNFAGEPAGTWNGVNVTQTPAYTKDTDATTFSATDLANIRDIHARVAEKFAPFNIDVTTEDPGPPVTKKIMKVVIGGDGAWVGNSQAGKSVQGSWSDATKPNVVYCFSKNLAASPFHVAETIAYDAGSAFGLHRNYTVLATGGVGTNQGNGQFAPIMGSSLNATRGLWWKGYNPVLMLNQDEPANLAAVIGYRTPRPGIRWISCDDGATHLGYGAEFARPGDANGDGRADFDDFLILSQHWGVTTVLGALVGDFDGNGVVNFDDWLILSQNYHDEAGRALPPPPTEVPTMPAPTGTLTLTRSSAKQYDAVGYTWTSANGAAFINGVAVPPNGQTSIPMPGRDTMIVLTVEAAGQPTFTDSKTIKLITDAPTPSPTPSPTPTAPRKAVKITYNDGTEQLI